MKMCEKNMLSNVLPGYTFTNKNNNQNSTFPLASQKTRKPHFNPLLINTQIKRAENLNKESIQWIP